VAEAVVVGVEVGEEVGVEVGVEVVEVRAEAVPQGGGNS